MSDATRRPGSTSRDGTDGRDTDAGDGRPASAPDAETDGHDPAGATAGPRQAATVAEEDRDAIRARLAPASAFGDETPLRVGLSPTAGVSAQRHPLVDGVSTGAELRVAGGDRYVLREGGTSTAVVIGPPSATADGTVREVVVDGYRFDVETVADRRAALREQATRAGSAFAATGPLEVRAAIPGKVVSVAVAVGEAVVAGQQLVVVEAMKMQNELRSPRDGTITRVGVGLGVNIELGDLLVVIS